MIKQTTTLIALISAGSILTAAYGCSSSTSGNGASNDAGTGVDTGIITTQSNDSGTTSKDSGTTSKDSGSPVSEDAGEDGGSEDAGPTCPGPVTTAQVPTYVSATPTPGICVDSDIVNFVTNCYSATATMGGCQTFLKTFNTTCLKCLAPQSSTALITGGPQVVNPTTADPLLNVEGCILATTTGQTACAADVGNLDQCEDVACFDCSDETTQGPLFQACADWTTPAPSCATYYTAANTDCPASDDDAGGVDGGAIFDECNDPLFVLTLYCGGATSDAGAGDGG